MREVDALLGTKRPTDDDLGLDVQSIHVHDAQLDVAVVHKDGAAYVHVGGEASVGHCCPLRRPDLEGLTGEREGLPFVQEHGPILHVAHADLRTLQVLEDRDHASGAAGFLVHHLHAAAVLVVRAVGEVEPRDVHPGSDDGA